MATNRGQMTGTAKIARDADFVISDVITETKQDMLITYIHNALQNPNSNINIYCNCSAEKITFSRENGEECVVDGVEGNFVDSTGVVKFKIRVNAKVVIISAGAIAPSQILLKNRIAGDKVGRGLSLHPAPFLLGKFDDGIHCIQWNTYGLCMP